MHTASARGNDVQEAVGDYESQTDCGFKRHFGVGKIHATGFRNAEGPARWVPPGGADASKACKRSASALLGPSAIPGDAARAPRKGQVGPRLHTTPINWSSRQEPTYPREAGIWRRGSFWRGEIPERRQSIGGKGGNVPSAHVGGIVQSLNWMSLPLGVCVFSTESDC
uniref:Peptidase_S8 domain-containing protein n=1 Tax=Steinernema glaseri TaxID=37863 RepID=A0A1I7ZVA8_9BILA